MSNIETTAEGHRQTGTADAQADALTSCRFSYVCVHLASEEAYWTVLDPAAVIVDSADGYLRRLRHEPGVDEVTTKQYARNLACFLTWAAAEGLDLERAGLGLRTFAAFLASTDLAADDAPLGGPQRRGQVLSAVRGFYLHLASSGAISTYVLGRLQEPVKLQASGMTSYAQNGEDLQIAYYVGRDRVTYVDVGCLWPRHFSNSYFFYDRGGSGLCIDANPSVAEAYASERPRDIFLNCGVSAVQGAMTYYMYNSPVFNTFSAEHAARLAHQVAGGGASPRGEARELLGTAEVPMMTLDAAVRSTDFDVRCDGQLDFLSVDVEGLELEVLSGFSFTELRPRLVVVEDFRRGSDARLPAEELPVTRAMADHRYWLAGRAGVNLYFMDEDR